MAAFCSKCGAPLPSNTGFCPSCGTAVGQGVVTPQPAFVPVPTPQAQPAPGYPPAQGYTQGNAGYPPAVGYPAAQAKSSGGATKIILIVVAVVVGIGVLGVGLAWYGMWRVSHVIKDSVHTDSKGNSTVSMLGGSISAGKDLNISASDLGVPIYPGAARAEGGMHMNLPTMSMVSAIYTTSDPVATVVAFYKGKLGENESDMDTDNGSVLSSGKEGASGKSGTVITIAPGTGDASGKTRISIVRTSSKEQ